MKRRMYKLGLLFSILTCTLGAVFWTEAAAHVANETAEAPEELQILSPAIRGSLAQRLFQETPLFKDGSFLGRDIQKVVTIPRYTIANMAFDGLYGNKPIVVTSPFATHLPIIQGIAKDGDHITGFSEPQSLQGRIEFANDRTIITDVSTKQGVQYQVYKIDTDSSSVKAVATNSYPVVGFPLGFSDDGSVFAVSQSVSRAYDFVDDNDIDNKEGSVVAVAQSASQTYDFVDDDDTSEGSAYEFDIDDNGSQEYDPFAVGFQEPGRAVPTGKEDLDSISVHNAQTGAKRAEATVGAPVHAGSFSSNNKYLLINSGGTTWYIWDWQKEGAQPIQFATFDEPYQSRASFLGSTDQVLMLQSTQDGIVGSVWGPHGSKLRDLETITPTDTQTQMDGQTNIASSKDGTLILLSVRGPQKHEIFLVNSVTGTSQPLALASSNIADNFLNGAFSKDGQHILVRTPHSIRGVDDKSSSIDLYHVQGQDTRFVRSYYAPEHLKLAALTPSGRHLIGVGAHLYVWSIDSIRPIFSTPLSGSGGHALAGEALIMTEKDDTLLLDLSGFRKLDETLMNLRDLRQVILLTKLAEHLASSQSFGTFNIAKEKWLIDAYNMLPAALKELIKDQISTDTSNSTGIPYKMPTTNQA